MKKHLTRAAFFVACIAMLALFVFEYHNGLDSKCYNGGNKHLFSPRYSRILPDVVKGEGITIEYLEALKDEIYIKDVCVWCGKEIKK